MALYVRLQTSFWTHRKTLRLRSLIGDEAFWIPQRMWCYAANNQPDGDFSKYSATEISMLLGSSKQPEALLEALQQAGFLDGLKIHNWKEHNAYHKTFADRAKKAAKARWSGEEKDKERKGKEGSIASSTHEASKRKGSLQELQDFCLSIQLPASDGEACFHKWEGNGWKNGNAAIKDWKSTIRAWKANGYMPSQKNGNGSAPHRPVTPMRSISEHE